MSRSTWRPGWRSEMYEFIRGPMMWASFLVFVFGLSYRLFVLVRATTRATPHSKRRPAPVAGRKSGQTFKDRFFIGLRRRIAGTAWSADIFVAIVSLVFHLAILVTPVFLVGHNVLLMESFGVSIVSFSEATSDWLTIILLGTALFLLCRRAVVSRVRAISTTLDYLLLIATALPFATGYFAYHQYLNYDTVIMVHMLSGELLLVLLGTTKLGHMLFYFFARFFVGGEYSLLAGGRRWQA
jgi:nitrate reductase gamma subunit